MRVGSFEVVSGNLVVSDPCYDLTGHCQQLFANAKLGRWVVSSQKRNMKNWGDRCCKLEAVHFDHRKDDIDWECVGQIGVDSGQAGIFDTRFYKDDNVVPSNFEGGLVPEEPWYSLCAQETLSDKGVGTIPYGAVSSSGFGDGTYDVYFGKTSDNTLIGLRIVFIYDDER